MKPGMPTLFSVYNKEDSNENISEKCMANASVTERKVPVISLSGNPFGVAVTVELLIRPALEKNDAESGNRPERSCRCDG